MLRALALLCCRYQGFGAYQVSVVVPSPGEFKLTVRSDDNGEVAPDRVPPVSAHDIEVLNTFAHLLALSQTYEKN